MPAAAILDAPGIYDVPAPIYHADPCPEPSLSASIATKLCLASAAHAAYAHPRLHPGAIEEESEAFDVGTAAHAILLEGVRNLVVVDAPDWRTKAARETRDQARAAGQVPLLKHKWQDVERMVAAARQQLDHHADGRAMFTHGQPEQTLVWIEDSEGDPVWCRARLDWLRPGAIDDFKTTGATANPETWTRTMFSYGFDIQAAWYLRGLRAITGIDDAIFRFAVQETYPPYQLAVVGLGPDALLLAEKKCRYALEVWREARRRGEWRGYPARTCYATVPMAHEAWWLEKEMR